MNFNFCCSLSLSFFWFWTPKQLLKDTSHLKWSYLHVGFIIRRLSLIGQVILEFIRWIPLDPGAFRAIRVSKLNRLRDNWHWGLIFQGYPHDRIGWVVNLLACLFGNEFGCSNTLCGATTLSITLCWMSELRLLGNCNIHA